MATITNDKEMDIMLDPFAEIGYKMDLILTLGEMLMECGACCDRMNREMKRAAAYMGIPESMFHLHINYTTLMLNVNDGKRSYTSFRKCRKHGVNMNNIDAISKLTWKIITERYDLQHFEAALKRLAKKPPNYTPLQTALCTSMATGGVCLLFGGDFLAMLYTMLATFIGFKARVFCVKSGMLGYAAIAISAFVATVAAFFTHYLPSDTPWIPMIACALYIVPGVPLIRAVHDLCDEYIVTGTARLTTTIIVCCAMAFGIICAICVCQVPYFVQLTTASNGILVSALGAAMSGVGYSVLFNVPKRLLLYCGLMGITCVTVRNFLMHSCGFDLSVASMFGAVAVCLVMVKLAHYIKCPMHVISIPAVITMIPGVLIYRMYFSIIYIGHMDTDLLITGVSNGIEAMLTIIGIAIGTIMPNIIFHKQIEQATNLHLEEMLVGFYSLEENPQPETKQKQDSE